MGKHRILVLMGDGIGPEVMQACLKVLDSLQEVVPGLILEYEIGDAGFYCIEKYGTNLPKQTVELFRECDACLKGPMTTPEFADAPPSVAVTLRKLFNLYANIRPCKTYPGLGSSSCEIDLVVVRENTEGLYFAHEFQPSEGVTCAVRVVTEQASRKVARFAFELARKRALKKKVTVVHKANILRLTCGTFKRACFDVAKQYPDITVEDLHIDTAAMQLISQPSQFDIIVTTNLFGDILSSEAAQLVGGVGIVPAANLGDEFAMFEPVHGSAPSFAGRNVANPTAMILAAKMMLDWLGEFDASRRIEQAVTQVLRERKRVTFDLGGNASTSEMAEAIAEFVKAV